MKIAIDARCITDSKRAGISTYLYEIIKYLEKEQLRLFYMKAPQEKLSELRKNIKQSHFYIPTNKPIIHHLWEEAILPFAINYTNPDLYWGPRFYTPPGLKCPSIATIHDIAFKVLPDIIDRRGYKQHSTKVNNAIKRSTKIITVSEASKNDICSYYNVKEDRIKVIYNGYSNTFSNELEQSFIRGVLDKFNIQNDFLLFVGTQEPRKNLQRLIEAYANSKAIKENIPLVLVGKKGWHMDGFAKTLNKFIDEQKVVLTGFVTEDELNALYQSCMYFVFPTLYEGFGIPVLEAMSAGAPVITSNNSAMKELFEGYSKLVDPYQIDSIQEGLDAMLDESLRNYYRGMGFERIKDFSWENCAKQHLNYFKEILS